MKRLTLICLFVFYCCNTPETNYYQPPNPPAGVEIFFIAEGNNTGDYLLVFRSENTTNTRFGGFFIFISDSIESVTQMQYYYEADYILGKDSQDSDTTNYNLGIDRPISILFSDNETPDTSITITHNGEQTAYTVTRRCSPSDTDDMIPGNFLTVRTYLYDSVNNEVLEVSSPGNCVEIPEN